MIHQVYVDEREIIHILRCMCIMGSFSEAQLLSFIGTGSLDCETLTITCRQEDFPLITLMIGEARTLFNTLEGLPTCAPLCMGIWRLKADHQCTICLKMKSVVVGYRD